MKGEKLEKQVLVVDDDPGVRRVVANVLRQRGYEVKLAENGQEGLETVREGFQGVILMDVTMPGLSGWKTIQGMVDEQLHQRVLICMLTGEPAGTSGEGLEQYVFDYLAKPFGAAELVQMVENARGFLEYEER